MAASPPSSAVPPTSSVASSLRPSLPPPPAALGADSQTNASSNSPASSPPSVSTATSPSTTLLPPPLANFPPPESPTSPAFFSPPPLSDPTPPPASSSQLTPTARPPAPAASPRPPTVTPPPASQPSLPLPSSPPPIPSLPPPPAVTVPPPSRSQSQPPPPPSGTQPAGSPPSPPSTEPPSSPPPPAPQTPPPSGSLSPPTSPNPSAPPPKDLPPTAPSPPSPPPSNFSGRPPSIDPSTPTSPPSDPSTTPSPRSSLTPPASNSPGLSSLSPPDLPASPGAGRSTTPASNDSLGLVSGRSGGGGNKNGLIVPIYVVSALVVLSVVGLAVWFMSKRRKKSSEYAAGFVMQSPMQSPQFSESSDTMAPSAPLMYRRSGTHDGTPGSMKSPTEPSLENLKSWFSFEELLQITAGFSEQNLLGEGGFGCVYKGCLPDGREVAVKQLKVGGAQGEREFRAEVEIISRVHHRHLVTLVGYCVAENQRLLVYDYVPNYTLHYHLHEQRNSVMDWAMRVKVAAGSARGIAYLHEDCQPKIIHRDIKSSNILLDNNFEAQVSDFGLARMAMDACTHVTTRVMGTFGYLAPEYASTGKLTERSDIFSFDVVLLELITGRKPVDSSQPLGDESLVEWARPLLSNVLETGDFGALPDPRLEKYYNVKEMFRMIEAAAACVRHSASMRPRMSLVVRSLDSLADIDLSNGLQPGQSELFNAGSQSEIRIFQGMAFGNQDFTTDFTQSSLTSYRDSSE